MDSKKLEEIAQQLRQPKGEKGIEMANMMHETNINMTLHAIEKIAIQADDIILELGHGNGKHIPYLLQIQQNINYYGLETSALMVREAKVANHKYLDQQAFFHLYDGMKIPFTDNYFTKIFTVNTLYFWHDPKSMLRELYRILQPNGMIALTFGQKKYMEKLPFTPFDFTLYDTDDVLALLADSGVPLEVIHIESQKERVKSKTNDWVEREFTTFSLKK